MIGDLIMLSPCIRALHAQYPDAQIALVGQASSISPYRHHPAVSELIVYDRSRGDWDLASFRNTVQALRRGRFDTAFIFHNSLGSALMAAFAGIRQRVGYRYEMRDLLLTHPVRMHEQRGHLLEEKAQLLEECGIPVANLAEEVYIDQARAQPWLLDKLGPNFGRSRPIIGLSIGATVEHKRWPARTVHDFLNMFPVNSVDFVFLGSPAEQKLFEGIYSYNNTVVDLAGQTTIEELTWVLNKCDVFVGPDSGPVHLAVGRSRPVVVLFAATDPRRCGPHDYPNSRIIRSERICPACDAKFGQHVRQCMHTIEAQEVFDLTVEILRATCPRFKL